MIVTITLIDLLLHYYRHAILDHLGNFFLFEWHIPGIPGGAMVLFIIPDRRREVLSQIKNFMHAFSIPEYAHLIGLLDAILDIKDVII